MSRPEKIQELAACLGFGSEVKHIDVAIPYLTADVAPNDPAWNETHSRWKSVSTLVGRDLDAAAQGAFAEASAASVKSAVRVLGDGVVAEDLDGALAFFHSAAGRRFLELQSALTDLSVEISLVHDTLAGGVSVENFDARRRVLQMWLPIVTIRTIYGIQTADRAMDVSYQRYSRLRGRELDALAQGYVEDLPQFEKFTESASFRRIIEAEKELGNQSPPPNLAEFFGTEARRHASQWHAAYLGS